MTDRCTDNQHKAEQYLSRFQGTPLGHLIDGKAVAGGREPALENRTPIDGTVINSVAMGGKAEIDLAVEAAAGAFAA
ncbi:MAG TPA: 5-carboxymethyl-2-hydroxymuconate semialdehyde dehydrogenase, partial [Gammaproteobacteria bacterium]|nr:5-carboxymethyl-2-hydroxymuconate semialdehyde dehydrogenase [Gammaproteobacteria bacterium]